ncbi:MAG: hypothetical protein KDD70_07925, partial [Bdellovibrionales bacterium]|nr:hypothetical protein [Bdellovibrionales bacterium]
MIEKSVDLSYCHCMHILQFTNILKSLVITSLVVVVALTESAFGQDGGGYASSGVPDESCADCRRKQDELCEKLCRGSS